MEAGAIQQPLKTASAPAAEPLAYLDAVAAGVPLFGSAMEAHRQGQVARARGLYLELADQTGLTAVCLHQLGVLASQTGDHPRAAELLRQAARLEPLQGLFHQNLALALERLGRQPEALEVLMEYGVNLQKANLQELAVGVYGRILSVDRCRYGAYINMGTAQALLGRARDAAELLIRGVALYGRLLPEARGLIDRITPGLVAAGTIPADADKPAGPPTGRIEVLEHALASLGKALSDLGHAEAAMASYRMAVTIDPGLALGHWNLALALLAQGDFEAGWREYEWRWHWDRFPEPKRLLPAPLWRGEPLAGKRIGIHAEQGFGDIIQFAPLVRRVAAMAAELVLEVPVPLVRLFRQSLEGERLHVVARTDDPTVLTSPAPLDFVVPLLSLPQRLGLKLDDLPLDRAYMQASETDRQLWRQRFAGLAGRKIGLVWAGRPAYADDSKRSMGLDILRPLFDIPGISPCISWVSLQVGPRRDEAASAGIPMLDAPAWIQDFADTAGAIAALDLVISVDTGVAHLAAAMGTPAWVLLPKVNDWRWLNDRADSPWYPTLRLFRQAEIGSWSGPVAAVRDALEAGLDATQPAQPRPRLRAVGQTR